MGKRKRFGIDNIGSSDESDGDISESDVPQVVKGNYRKCKRSDAMIKKAVMEEVLMDIDLTCSSACAYGRKCRNQPGFFDFIRELRTSFWGARGSKPLTNERRRDIIKNIRKRL